MASNVITLSGNLVKDPELAATKEGKFVLSFRIAVDDAGGKEKAGFFTCQAWGDLAENLAETLSKGQRVIVSGQLRHRQFEVEGKPRSAIDVFVSDAGPSMLWATAKVEKRARAGAGARGLLRRPPSAAGEPRPRPRASPRWISSTSSPSWSSSRPRSKISAGARPGR